MICIYAVAEIKPGCKEAFLKAANRLVNYTRAEAGNIRYHLAQDSEERYVFMEFWTDEAACREHMTAAHFIEAGKQFEGLLKRPLEIHKMDAIL